MRDFSIDERLEKILKKIYKKDRKTYDILIEKIKEIINVANIAHYKNLRKPLQHLKRVHIQKSFVLTFRYLEKEDKVIFYDFDHHNNIYK